MIHTKCCQEKINLAVNSGAVFLLCILLSIIKCLSSAALVTFGAPGFFLLIFVSVSYCLCNEYQTPYLEIILFLAIVFESSLLGIEFQFVLLPQCLVALILPFCANCFKIKSNKQKRDNTLVMAQRQLCFGLNKYFL